MTETPGTDLVVLAGQGALNKNNATAADVLAAMYAAELQEVITVLSSSQPIPRAISVSPEQEKAVGDLLEYVDTIKFPSEVRKLEPNELDELMGLRLLADQVLGVVEATKTSIRDSVMNHFDVVAEENGWVDGSTYLTDEYHYVIKDRTSGGILGMAKKFVRTVRRGKLSMGPQATLDDNVMALLNAGEIDRKTYLRWTRAVRVVNEEAMFKDMKDPVLMRLIRKVTRISRPTAALEIADNDGDEE